MSKEGDNSFVADDQGNKFTVPSRILTNDLDVRDALLKTLTGQQDKARQSAKANATVTNQVRESRAKKMQDDIVHLNLRIEELTMARSRAQEELEAESKKKTASGDSLMGVERVRGAIAQIDSQIKIAQRKIEDTQMAIKKEQLGQ